MGQIDYDLVIVGMGAAGLSAALSCTEASGGQARIAIIERASKEERGGATRWTNSNLRLTPDGAFDPKWRSLVAEQSNGLADDEYCRVLEEHAVESLDFVKGYGVQVEGYPMPIASSVIGEDGESRFWVPVGGGASIVEHLGNAADDREQIDVLYETEAVRLHVEDGDIRGVVVRGADGLLQTVRGRHVLLACGGFEGNAEMLTQYVGPTAVDLVPIAPGIKFNTGDGIRMAQEMGAGTAGQFDMIHAEGVDSRSSKADAVVWSYMFGIVVNQAGQRFFDEGANVLDRTFELLGNEIWRNQNQQAFLIADRKYLDVPGVEFLNVTDLPPIQADTIEELAKLLSVDTEGLAATIGEYNDATQDGVFDPSILDGLATQGIAPPKSNWAQRIEEGPFVAYPLTGAVTFTFGGLRVDADGHVLTQAGRVIPHLFAAGEITGLYYHEYACATSVLRSLTFGRRVGQLVGTALPASAAIA